MTDANVTRFGPEFRIHATSPDHGDRLAEWVPIIGQAADATTTIIGLRKGYVESNPVVAIVTGNPTLFAVGKLLAGIGMHFVVKSLRESGHPGWAKALGWSTFAEGAIPAALNIRTIRKG